MRGGILFGLSAGCVCLASVLAVSCGTMEIDRIPLGEGHQSDTLQQPSEEKVRHLYVTGVEYPEGYDWHSDKDYGHVACTLFLMKGDERILEIPAGDEIFVSPDHDMHRCVDGHVYTDYSTDTETIIKKDGEELFRYPDREMICGFQVQGEDVYTLGVPRNGDGWTYRVNGKILMVKTAGYLMTGLGNDRGNFWFAYVDPIENAGKRCYLAVNGSSVPVGTAQDIETVDDILLYDGKIYYAARVTGMPQHLVYAGDEAYAVELESADESRDCRVHYDGGIIYVTGKKCYWGIGEYETLWEDFMSVFNYPGKKEMQYCVDGDRMNYVLMGQDNDDRDYVSVFKNCIYVELGDDIKYNYMSLGRQCVCAEDGHLYVALHPRQSGRNPALLSDDVVKVYDFNGYFTSVSVW